MSYLFDGDDSLVIDVPIARAVPITMACWSKVADVINNHTLVALLDKDVDFEYFVISAGGAVSGDPIRVGTSTTGNSQFASTTAGYTVDTWLHSCAVYSASNSRAAYLNGGNKGTDTANVVPVNIDRFVIGRLLRLNPASGIVGRVAEVAIWVTALSDTEVAALAAGANPLDIGKGYLAFYAPLENDAIDVYERSLTINGAVLDADHPTVDAPTAPDDSGPPPADAAQFPMIMGLIQPGDIIETVPGT